MRMWRNVFGGGKEELFTNVYEWWIKMRRQTTTDMAAENEKKKPMMDKQFSEYQHCVTFISSTSTRSKLVLFWAVFMYDICVLAN